MNPGIFNLLTDVFGEDAFEMKNRHYRSSMPAVNVRESENAYEIELAVPGFEKSDLNVEVEKDTLKVTSKKEQVSDEKNDKIRRMEFSYNHFERSFLIPEEADADKIKAKSENGILYINLPKKEEKGTAKKMIKVA